MGGAVSKVVEPVKKVFKAVRVANFLGNINPFVAIGVLAIGWLFIRSRKPEVPDFDLTDEEEELLKKKLEKLRKQDPFIYR